MKNINKFKMENIIYTNEKITKKKKVWGSAIYPGPFGPRTPLKIRVLELVDSLAL